MTAMLTKNNWLLPSLGALVLWGGWAFLPKLALETLSVSSTIFYEAIGGLLVSGVALCVLKGKLDRNRLGIIITSVASIFSIGALMFYYYAVQLGPVAVISTMGAMYPVVALVMARVFLKDRLNRTQMLAVLMAIASLVLLVN